jgi:hypothetical protein
MYAILAIKKYGINANIISNNIIRYNITSFEPTADFADDADPE